jgi:hypothetical protein
MHDEWQIVKERRKSAVQREPRVYVSLNKRGEIALNPRAWAAIRQPWNVVLMYDAARRRIGVKYPVPGDRELFSLRNYGRDGRMRIVSAGRLLKQFGIEIERTLVFRDPRVDPMGKKEPMLVLALDKAWSVVA